MKQFLSTAFRWINNTRKVILNLIFFGLIIALFSLSSPEPSFEKIGESGVVTVNLDGIIVEQQLFNSNLMSVSAEETKQIVLFDLIDTINDAAEDPRVTGMILLPAGLLGASHAALDEIGQALDNFKAAGKPILATGPYLSQNGYILASYADEIYIGPMGGIDVSGLATFSPYFGEMLERFGIEMNVFKVGTYKSAVEPYINKGMSAAAKENAQQWIGDLWGNVVTTIEGNRHLEAGTVTRWLDHYPDTLSAHDGSFADMALQVGLIDGIKSRAERIKRLQEFANDHDDNPGISWLDYHTQRTLEKVTIGKTDQIGVVVASGSIIDGKQAPGMIGGDSTAALIREAVKKEVKAIVLRVNSPGGSANASEVIREEILVAKSKGIPVVISMGGVAASGGYWISASADRIFANPQTITGSIGVFGLIPTFGKLANEYGVYSDGVATTPIAGGFDTINGINEPTRRTIQLSIENIYSRFLNIVAEGRDSDVESIDKIAQGRVWSGLRAAELGLVDDFGTLQDAINYAAELASVENFKPLLIEQELTPMQQFIQEFKKNNSAQLAISLFNNNSLGDRTAKLLKNKLNMIEQLNDPQHVYATCFGCSVSEQ